MDVAAGLLKHRGLFSPFGYSYSIRCSHPSAFFQIFVKCAIIKPVLHSGTYRIFHAIFQFFMVGGVGAYFKAWDKGYVLPAVLIKESKNSDSELQSSVVLLDQIFVLLVFHTVVVLFISTQMRVAFMLIQLQIW